MSDARQICRQAAGLVSGDRAATHGDKLSNFQNTADHWNATLNAIWRRSGGAGNSPVQLTALDTANMMESLKIARRYSGAHNLDDYIDGAGWAGCAGEVAERTLGSEAHTLQAPVDPSPPAREQPS